MTGRDTEHPSGVHRLFPPGLEMAKLPLAEAKDMVALLREISDQLLLATDESCEDRDERLMGVLRDLVFARSVLEDAVRDAGAEVVEPGPGLFEHGGTVDG